MFRATTVPRDIVDRPPDEEFAEDILRLSAEQLDMQLGKQWGLNYGVSFGATFDDNVTLSNTNQKSDVILTGGATVALRLGTDATNFFLTGVYGISYGSYLNGADDPVLGHSLGLRATYRFTKLTLGLNVSMSYGAGGTVDTGMRTNRDSYFANLSASYAYSEKVSFELAMSGTSLGYENLLSSRDTRINAAVDYTLTPKLRVGLGAAYGITKADEGSVQQPEVPQTNDRVVVLVNQNGEILGAFRVDGGDERNRASVKKRGGGVQTSQQVMIRASYTATEKLTASGSAGVEFRQTDGGGNVSPVFSIGAAYRPFERTTISLDLSRRIYTSAVLAGQDYTATGATLSVSQQLTSRLSFSLGLGYEYSEYFGAAEGVDSSRNDKYLSFRSSLNWAVARWCSLGAYYEYSDSASTGEGARPFSRNRLGLQLSLMF